MARLLCLLVALVWTHQATAQTPRSINSVPADAAFFLGLHNQADMIRRVAGSETVKKIRALAGDDFDLPETLGIDVDFNADDNSVVDPDNYLVVLKQLLRSDVFLYGDANWAHTVHAVHQLSQQSEQAKKEQGDQYDGFKFFLSLSDEELAKVRMPSTVLGFQLDDVDPAQRLFDQLHAWLKANPPPPWAQYRGRKPVGGDHMLVFTLRPWESDWIKVNWTEGDQLAVSKKLQRIIEERELVIAFGVVQSRLTVCFAEDLSAVRRLVEVEVDDSLKSIADQPDFESMLNQQDGSLIASAYISDDFVAARNELQAPGVLTSLSAFLGAVPSMITNPEDFDAAGMAMVTGITETLSERFASIATRWDALASKPAGWSMAVWAGPGGFSGRTFVRAVDERLPKSPLDVHQFTGEHVLFVYGWQSTTLAQRLLLAYETAESVIDAMTGGALLGMELDIPDDIDVEKIRQGRTKMANSVEQLNMIVREQWLPSLRDGGHAIVVSAVDPVPETDDESPVAISLLTRVSSSNGLQQAGTSLRNWANDFVSNYYAMADEPLDGPLIPAPLAQDDRDSMVFRFPLAILGGSDEESAMHWRLNDQLLVFSSDAGVSKKMLKPRKENWSDREGVLRSVAELSFVEIGDLYSKAIKMVPKEDRPAMRQAGKIIGTLNAFRSETRTIDGQTRTYWQLAMPLGE